MINGSKILLSKYPEFDEDSRTPNGLDLRLGKVYELSEEYLLYGLYEDKKIIPEHILLPEEESNRKRLNKEKDTLETVVGWTLEPNRPYILEVNEPITISKDSAQLYKPRSTLLRCGVTILTAVGDAGYNGHLAFLCINYSSRPFFIEKNVRFAQLIDFEIKGNDQLYDGDFQEKIDDTED